MESITRNLSSNLHAIYHTHLKTISQITTCKIDLNYKTYDMKITSSAEYLDHLLDFHEKVSIKTALNKKFLFKLQDVFLKD